MKFKANKEPDAQGKENGGDSTAIFFVKSI